MAWLNNDGLMYLWAKLKAKFSLKSEGVKTITRNGLTFTVTRADDTTFTFDQTGISDLSEATGTLGVGHGGTGANTFTTGLIYHATPGTGAMSVATASQVVSEIGDTPVARATADASGDNIADTYAKKTDITGVYKYKGSVANAAALPQSGQVTGDVYNIEAASAYGAAGANVAWNGSAWDSLGEVFSISAITNAEIDAIVAV